MIRGGLLFLEAGLFAVFLAPVFVHVCNAGNIAGMLVSGGLFLLTACWHTVSHWIRQIWQHLAGKIGCGIVAVLLLSGIAFVTVCSIQMLRYQNRPPKQPNTVIVLGCKVKGTTPSLMLRRRLEAAATYLSEHETAFCIVSGGQGPGESISEAQAMQTYLTAHGIAADRILLEDQSTDTAENIANSKAILEQQGLPLQVTLITDGFHQYRAHLLAEQNGLEAWSVSGATRPILVPTYWVREWMALAEYKLHTIFR